MLHGNAGAMATAEPQCSTANIVQCRPVFGCMDAEHFDNVKASGDDCVSVIDESNTCQSNENCNAVVNHDVHDNDKSCFFSYESYRDFVTLQYVNVSIDEIQEAGKISNDRPVTCIKALEDSGSELCIVKSSLVES